MRIQNHIRSAVGKLSQHKQLSHDNLVTHDFGQIVPVIALPLLPRDKFKIRASCFARVAPMIFPTYGSCDVVTNFHSVQYNQVWRDFDLFVSGQTYRGATGVRFPVLRTTDLCAYFLQSTMGVVVQLNQNPDIEIKLADGTNKYVRLSLFGRYVRKVLSGLGYPYFKLMDASSSRVYSALPLLSFMKVYHDFYESRQYSQNSVIAEILRECYSSLTGTYFDNGPSIEGMQSSYLNVSGISIFFQNLLLLYPSDYFTSAQAYPSMVGGSRPISVPATSGNSSLTNSEIRSPFVNPYELDQTLNSTQYTQTPIQLPNGDFQPIAQSNPSHRLLDNFENLVRRFNLVGSREIDRIRSLFGIRPSTQRNQYSTFHGGFSSDLKIQDITSTSSNPDTDTYLGSYAGKGIVSNGGSFSIDSDDFGMLLGFSFIRVRPLYTPGIDRETLKVTASAYYNPEFDHGYAMAVSCGEVVSSPDGPDQNYDGLFKTFGFQNAYDEYRQRVSRINGDFVDSDLLPWSFVRENLSSYGAPVAQSSNLIYQSSPYRVTEISTDNAYNEYQRIFVDGSGRDHFYLYFGFGIEALRPVRTSSECFDLGVGDVSTSNNPVI